MNCPNCGFENEAGRKFCGECGSGLARPCPSCGTPNAPSMKFCEATLSSAIHSFFSKGAARPGS